MAAEEPSVSLGSSTTRVEEEVAVSSVVPVTSETACGVGPGLTISVISNVGSDT